MIQAKNQVFLNGSLQFLGNLFWQAFCTPECTKIVAGNIRFPKLLTKKLTVVKKMPGKSGKYTYLQALPLHFTLPPRPVAAFNRSIAEDCNIGLASTKGEFHTAPKTGPV